MTDPTTPNDKADAIQTAQEVLFDLTSRGEAIGFTLVIATRSGSQAIAWYDDVAAVHTLTGALVLEMHQLARCITDVPAGGGFEA